MGVTALEGSAADLSFRLMAPSSTRPEPKTGQNSSLAAATKNDDETRMFPPYYQTGGGRGGRRAVLGGAAGGSGARSGRSRLQERAGSPRLNRRCRYALVHDDSTKLTVKSQVGA